MKKTLRLPAPTNFHPLEPTEQVAIPQLQTIKHLSSYYPVAAKSRNMNEIRNEKTFYLNVRFGKQMNYQRLALKISMVYKSSL